MLTITRPILDNFSHRIRKRSVKIRRTGKPFSALITVESQKWNLFFEQKRCKLEDVRTCVFDSFPTPFARHGTHPKKTHIADTQHYALRRSFTEYSCITICVGMSVGQQMHKMIAGLNNKFEISWRNQPFVTFFLEPRWVSMMRMHTSYILKIPISSTQALF